MTEIDEVVNKSLFLAGKYLKEGKPGRSYAHLLIVLKLKPQWKEKLVDLFIETLCDWERYLTAEGRFTDLFACYEQALEHFKHPKIYNNLGLLLYRVNYHKEAIKYFQLALSVNNEYLPAIKNVYNLFNESVERWHFRMLNDTNRNLCFRKAISNKINAGHKSILDIGTGTGLLSIYAKLEGAETIYACDYSEVMIDIANDVIKTNLPPDSIILIPKLSNDIVFGKDLLHRCSLIITETIDAAIFGERILQSLIHAWEKLLIHNVNNENVNATVIPESATLYICPIQCLKIARMNHIIREEQLETCKINFGNVQFCPRKTEPYDTENLRLVKHDFLANHTELFKINFNNVKEMKQFLNGSKNIQNLPIVCTRNGFINALAVWFDLHLDETITLSSSPNSSVNCCWDQAILPLNQPYYVENGAVIKLNIECNDGVLKAIISNANNTFDNFVITSPEIIRFLNCKSLYSIFESVVDNLQISSELTEKSKILDLSPFPVFGFILAQKCTTNITAVTEIIEELPYLLCKNNIKNDFQNIGLEELLSSLKTEDDKFDVIVLNYLQSTGELNEELINNIPRLRPFLKPGGLILPSKINICCKLINSDQLINESEVIDPLLKTEIKLADYINFYKVPYRIDLNMDEILYTNLSNKFTIGELNFENLSAEENVCFEEEVDIIEIGLLNSILCWFELDFDGRIFPTNTADSYTNQIAWLINSSIKVKKSDRIHVRLLYNQSYLYFSNVQCIKKKVG